MEAGAGRHLSSSRQSKCFRGTTFPVGVSSRHELGGGQVHSHSQQGSFWGRADPPGPLFATGSWAASLQPGQPLLGISGGDKWAPENPSGFPCHLGSWSQSLGVGTHWKRSWISPLSPSLSPERHGLAPKSGRGRMRTRSHDRSQKPALSSLVLASLPPAGLAVPFL